MTVILTVLPSGRGFDTVWDTSIISNRISLPRQVYRARYRIATLPGTAELAGDGGRLKPGTERARAFVPIWRRPWMSLSGGTYGSSLLAALGVANVFAGAEARYPEVTLDAARAARPDVVLAPSEPYPFRERHVEELSTVAPVVLVDGQDLFWWGERTEAALDRLGRNLADHDNGRG